MTLFLTMLACGRGDSEIDSDIDSDSDTDIDSDIDSDSLRLALPAYVYPTSPTWAAWQEGAAASGGLMVLNPASGPGGSADPVYVAAAAAAREAGVIVLGYVPTSYGARDPAAVDAEVAAYAAWYGVDGIFYDEVPGAEACATAVPWYAARAAYADTLATDGDAFVALNPGLVSCEGYLDTAELLVVAENTGAGLAGWAPADWMAAHPADRFWFLAYAVATEADMAALLARARAANVGWVYVTDDVAPNPWDGLPAYWEAERAGL